MTEYLMPIATILLAISVAWLAFETRGKKKTALGRINNQSKANNYLVDSPTGKEVLAEFLLSEAKLKATLHQFEDAIKDSPDEGMTAIQLANSVEKKSRWQKIKDIFKTHGGAFVDKIVDKLNDLAKGSLGLGGNGKEE